MAKKKAEVEKEVEPEAAPLIDADAGELEGEVGDIDLPTPGTSEEPTGDEVKAPAPIEEPLKQVSCPFFEEPADYKHSFELEFILDVLQSEYSQKEKSVITRPSGATLLENTYRPIFSSEGIGGIRRETVFSYQGSYYRIAASCSPEQDQRFIHWDYPAINSNDVNVVMAQKVDPIQKTVTTYVPSTE